MTRIRTEPGPDRDRIVREAVKLWLDRREAEYGFGRWESVTHLSRVVREAGVDFPASKPLALAEFVRLGYRTRDVARGTQTPSTYVVEAE